MLRQIGAFVLLFISIIILYLPAFPAGKMALDDDSIINVPQIVLRPDIQSIKSIFTPGSHIDFYPVRDLSYVFDMQVLGGSLTAMRIHQLLLMFLLAVVLFAIFRKLNIPPWPSFLLMAFYIFHPVQAEMFLWLSARKDVLALLFGAISILFFLIFLEEKKTYSAVLSFLFYILCVFSKASLILLPFVGLWATILNLKGMRQKKILIFLGVGTLVSGLASVLQSWFYHYVDDMSYSYSLSYRLGASAAALGKMAGGWFYSPWNIIDVENWGQWFSLNKDFVVIGVALWFIFLISFLVTLLKKEKLINLILVATALAYLPISGLFFPHKNFYSIRYFDPVALILLLGFGYYSFKKNGFKNLVRLRPAGGVFLILLFSILAFANYEEGRRWGDSVGVARKALSQEPESISLKTEALLELYNAINTHPLPGQREEYGLLYNDLNVQCDLEQSKEKVWFSNCRRYFIIKWNELSQKGDFDGAQKWLLDFQQTFTDDATAKMPIERYLLSNGLRSGRVTQNNLLRWKTKVFWFPTPEYRLQQWTVSCLLGDLQGSQRILTNYLNEKLLRLDDASNFIQNEVAPALRIELSSCLSQKV